MKLSYILKWWYWGDEPQPPRWWATFIKKHRYCHDVITHELQPFATVKEVDTTGLYVVFNSPKDLTLFMLRWS